MEFRFGTVLAVAGGALLAAGAASAQTISGTVVFDGKAPAMKPVAMDADPVCAKKHANPVLNEVLVLGPGQTMANVMVSVTKGLPAGKAYPAPKDPVVLDQNGCKYSPHVMGIMVGQPFKILNSDGLLHNVHALPKVNKQFNMAMPPNRTEAIETFTQAEGMFAIKCDVHPWMQAFIGVMSHPFFSVTKEDGKFSIANLEPGTYELTAWHEKLPVQTATVTIGAKESKTVAFKFAAPTAPAK